MSIINGEMAYEVDIPVTCTVDVAVALAVMRGVTVTVVVAGVSKQVQTAAIKLASRPLRLLNFDSLASRYVGGASRLPLAAAVTVVIVVSKAVGVTVIKLVMVDSAAVSLKH